MMKRIYQYIQTVNPLIVISLIFFVGLLLRLYRLGSIPATFQEDEILSGYVGRYILQNGKDIYGNPWPLLYFNKFGDYYIVLPMYLVGISTYLFGITEFAVRFPAALLGSLVVFPIFWLTRWTFNSKNTGYIAAFLIIITPWHWVLSRGMVEGIIGSTIFLSGIVLLLKYIRSQSIRYIILSSLLFLLSYMIYHPFRLYVPLVFLPLYFLFSLYKNKKMFVTMLVVNICFFLLTFYISTTPWGSGRFQQTSIFSDISGVQIKTQQQIFNMGDGKVAEARIFHNKVVGYSREFAKQYVTYFSPIFLFIQGGVESRYDVPEQGLLYISFLIYLIVLAIPFFKSPTKTDSRYTYYLVYLILLSPLPAAFTYIGSPNVHRAALLGILLVIPAAYGLHKLIASNYRYILIPLVVILLSGEVIYFWHQYTTQADIYNSLRRNDGFKKLAEYAHDKSTQYDEVILPAEGNTALYYLFFTKDFSSNYSSQFQADAHIDRVGNVRFIKATCPTEVLSEADRKKNILVVNRHSCAESVGYDQIGKITGVNELLSFKVLRPAGK
ncbi:hypothetical protein BH09PAT2_BH09PAT2_09060 [soil metagenome]